MKAYTVTSAIGVLTAVVGGLAGFADTILLAGFGICGGPPLSAGMVVFAALTTLLPASAAGIFPGPWWIPALIFSAPLPLAFLAGKGSGEWGRSAAALLCVALAFGGAWFFKCAKWESKRGSADEHSNKATKPCE